jgi:hypothetical protein
LVSPANVICFGISGSGISLSRCLVYYVLRSEMALERSQACFGGGDFKDTSAEPGCTAGYVIHEYRGQVI